jgi:uncharacterized protein YbjT (DUF2867 family)
MASGRKGLIRFVSGIQVARGDYAEAAAAVLTSDNQAGRVYELAGDNSYSLTELAA